MSIQKNSPLRQLTLNFGQKSPKTSVCKECGMIVDSSCREDQQIHEKLHRAEKSDREKALIYSSTLSKSEHVVKLYADGRCVVVSPDTAAKPIVSKIMSILAYVDQDLGIHDSPDRLPSMTKIYLFVSNASKIDGFCLTEPVVEAYWSAHTDRGSLTYDESRPERGGNMCGISRIWVSRGMRRHGVATRLLDCVCVNFLYVAALDPRRQLAFSDPTESGQALAKAFIKSEKFLVYKHRNRV